MNSRLAIPVSKISTLLGHNKRVNPNKAIGELLVWRYNKHILKEIVEMAYDGKKEAIIGNKKVRAAERKAAREMKDSNFDCFVSSEVITRDTMETMREKAMSMKKKYNIEEIGGVKLENFAYVERGKKMELNTLDKLKEMFKITRTQQEYNSDFNIYLDSLRIVGYRICGKSDATTSDNGVLEIKNRVYSFYKAPPNYEVDQLTAYVAMGGHSYGVLVEQYEGELKLSKKYSSKRCLQRWASMKKNLEYVVLHIDEALRDKQKSLKLLRKILPEDVELVEKSVISETSPGETPPDETSPDEASSNEASPDEAEVSDIDLEDLFLSDGSASDDGPLALGSETVSGVNPPFENCARQ